MKSYVCFSPPALLVFLKVIHRLGFYRGQILLIALYWPAHSMVSSYPSGFSLTRQWSLNIIASKRFFIQAQNTMPWCSSSVLQDSLHQQSPNCHQQWLTWMAGQHKEQGSDDRFGALHGTYRPSLFWIQQIARRESSDVAEVNPPKTDTMNISSSEVIHTLCAPAPHFWRDCPVIAQQISCLHWPQVTGVPTRCSHKAHSFQIF